MNFKLVVGRTVETAVAVHQRFDINHRLRERVIRVLPKYDTTWSRNEREKKCIVSPVSM